MIFVEWRIIDHRTMSIAETKLEKQFKNGYEFAKWYDMMKKDKFAFLNIMNYNPKENEFKTTMNYLKLVQTKMELQ